MRNVRLILTTLALAFLVTPSIAGDSKLVAREGKGRLELVDGHRVLHIAGTPYEMGFQHGRLLADVVKLNIKTIADNESELGDRIEYKIYKELRSGMHEQLLPYIPKRFLEEMRGLAKGAGVPYEKVLAANLFPEAFHCSGMALKGKATHDGSLYHVRILDYMTDAGLQDSATTIIAHPDKGHPFMNVSFAGFVGSVTGMNGVGIAIGEIGGAGQFHWDGIPMAFLVRDVLERATHLKEARAILRDAKRTCEYYYVVSDSKIPDAYGVQATAKRIQFMKMGEPFALLDLSAVPTKDSAHRRVVSGHIEETEFYRQIKSSQGTVTICTPPKDTVVVTGDSRFAKFCHRLMKRHYGKTDHLALERMVRRPVSLRSNLHVVIFHPASRRAWIAIAGKDGSPACNQPYVEVTLDLPKSSERAESKESAAR